MTIKIIIPHQQWIQYGEDKCRGWRTNEYGDIYFVTDISFLLIMFNFPPFPMFSYIVNKMKKYDKGDATIGDISLYFDFDSGQLFHDRELKDRTIILCLKPTFITDKLRDRISSFPNTMALAPNILLMENCGINGHMACLGKIKRIAEFLVIEEKHKECFNVIPDVQVEDDCSVVFTTGPYYIPIVTIL